MHPATLPALVAVPVIGAGRPGQRGGGAGGEEVEEAPADDDVVVEGHDVRHETRRHSYA